MTRSQYDDDAFPPATETMLALAMRVQRAEIKALSIKQPYPHHIFHDGKDVENRTWGTRGRGWVLVHAGKRSEDPEYTRERNIPLGGFVGAMRITDCVQEMDSEWFYGPYGFVIAEAFAFDLVPSNGALGFFKPDPAILPDIAAAIRARAASGIEAPTGDETRNAAQPEGREPGPAKQGDAQSSPTDSSS